MSKLYNVDLQTYQDKLIKRIGVYTIDKIRKLAQNYIGGNLGMIGVVFNNENDIDKSIEYIKENGEELWLLGNHEQIRIERTSENE